MSIADLNDNFAAVDAVEEDNTPESTIKGKIDLSGFNTVRKAQDLTWEFDEDGILYISGNGSMPDFTADDDRLPWKAFRNEIKSVDFQEGITYIGARSFAGCTSLTDISLSKSIKSIGFAAFEGCTQLDEIMCPAGTTIAHLYEKKVRGEDYIAVTGRIYAGMRAFYRTPWAAENWGDFVMSRDIIIEYLGEKEDVVVPEGVTSIGTLAFDQKPVRSVKLPASLRKIGDNAFAFTRLREVNIPASVEHIGRCAFAYIAELQSAVINRAELDFDANVFAETPVAGSVKKVSKKWPSIYSAVFSSWSARYPELKRVTVRRKSGAHFGLDSFDTMANILPRLRKGAVLARVCFSQEKKLVEYVQCFAFDNDSGKYPVYAMFPCAADGSDRFSVWTSVKGELSQSELLHVRTAGLWPLENAGSTSCEWFCFTESDSFSLGSAADILLREWFTSNRGYSAPSEDELEASAKNTSMPL